MPADNLPVFISARYRLMIKLKASRFVRSSKLFKQSGLFVSSVFFLLSALLLVVTPALAHHPMGGKMPTSFLDGFMTGIAHPLIGPDHFAFIVAVGLMAVTKKQGILIPIVFVLSAMMGTGLHLAQFNVPGIELFVSGSILVFGILLAIKSNLNTSAIAGLAAIAGLFHGYAYGEAIFGAEMTPVLAYLIGFTVIQLVVSLSAFGIGKTMLRRENEDQISPKLTSDKFRSAGLIIFGVGLAFFTSQVVGIIFPLPNA
jgi:urease accessory protein